MQLLLVAQTTITATLGGATVTADDGTAASVDLPAGTVISQSADTITLDL